jgi:phosphoadenosine phosphosulfate reductase
MELTQWTPGATFPTPPPDLYEAAARLEDRPAEEILSWALARFRQAITLACSFGGPSGMVLLDMVLQLAPDTPVFYLDTGLLFPETQALVERVRAHYAVEPRAVRPVLSVADQARIHGHALWNRDPDACCTLRKVAPQRDALRGYEAWITGLRRDQAATRRSTPALSWDAHFGLVKVAPLAHWEEPEVWSYIRAHAVPYNALHDQGYPSIGCVHCTRPIQDGEHPRAGRWSGQAKTECGLHRGQEGSRAG